MSAPELAGLSEADQARVAEFQARIVAAQAHYQPEDINYPELMAAHPWPTLEDVPELSRRARDGTVFCVGCGPSLREQDPALTSYGVVLGCNRAWKWRDPDAAVFLDSRALRESAAEGAGERCPIAFVAPQILPCAVVGQRWVDAMRTFPRVYLTQGLGKDVPMQGDVTRGFGGLGGSVIFGAIQVAMWLRPWRIVLLGVDLDYSDKRSAYFYEHPEIAPGHEVQVAPALAAVAWYRDECKALGIELLNCNPGGNINLLPRVTLEEL